MRDASRFWLTQASSASSDTWVKMTGPGELDPVGEPLMTALQNGADPEGPPELRVWNRGRKRGDMLWSGGSTFTAISDRAVDVLKGIDASGWRAIPARTRFANGQELPGYQVLVVAGTCGDFFSKEAKKKLPRRATGVDPSYEWDGSDVFWIRGWQPQFVFCVTDRVCEAFEAGGLERIDYADPADYYR